MRHWYRLSCLAPTVVAGLVAVQPAAAEVVLSFTGIVTDVGSIGLTPPSGVDAGAEVTGRVTYNPAEATVIAVGPGERVYMFMPGSGNEFTIEIGPHVWKTDLQSLDLCNEVCQGDFLNINGVSLTSENFPNNAGTGILVLGFSDSESPFDLLDGHDLPNSTEDINFGSADSKNGAVSSNDENSGFWTIAFDVNESTVPATPVTWSQVKTLYARP